MKTLTKIIVIILIAGIVIAGAGFAMTGFDVDALTKAAKVVTADDFIEEEKTVEGNFGEIIIDVRNQDVVLARSQDGKFHIKHFVSDEYLETTYSDKNGVIKLVSRDKWLNLLFAISVHTGQLKLTVEVPESFAGKIDFRTTNSKITAETSLSFESLSLKTSNGRISVKNITVKNDVSLSSSNESIQIENASVGGALTLKTSNSGVTLRNVASAGATDITTSNGRIAVSNCALKTAVLKSTNDSIAVDGSAFDSLKAATSNGRITLDRVASAYIDLKTSNDEIDANVNGKFADFKIDVKTSNDRITVNGEGRTNGIINQSASNLLKAHTSNGGIVIKFNKE